MHHLFFKLAINILLLSSFTILKTDSKASAISKFSDASPKNRQGRTTYVKAILSDSRASPSHLLAEKLARETLRSSRTQETLKKLTQIKSAIEKRRANDYAIPKQRRKAKRKKHRHKPKRHRRRHRKIKNHQISGKTNGKFAGKRLISPKIQAKQSSLRTRISRQTPNNKSQQNTNLPKNTNNSSHELFDPPLPISRTTNVSKKNIKLHKNQDDVNYNFVNPALPITAANNVSKKNVKSLTNRNTMNYNYLNAASPILYANNVLKKNAKGQRNQKFDNFNNYDYFDAGLPISSLNEGALNPLYPEDYISPQSIQRLPLNPMESYSFEAKANYFPQIQQNSQSVDTKPLNINKHDVSAENSMVNCTEIKIDTSTELTKNIEEQKEVKNVIPITLSRSGEVNSGLETKQVANEILNDIIEELEELKLDHNKNNPREGLPCKISGFWSSIQAGVELKFKVTNHTLNVTFERMATSAKLHSGILNTTWNVTGHVPFKRGAPFALVASNVYIKSLATFVGACRVCQGIDVIEGIWSVIKEPHTCRDFPASVSTYTDVFRRILATSKATKQKT